MSFMPTYRNTSRLGGFTIIELVVVVLILGILITLATVSLSKSEYKSRNVERESDTANFARGLELRYNQGNPQVAAPGYVSQGSYPGANEMRHITGVSIAGFTPAQIAGGYIDEVFPGVTARSLTPPTKDADFDGFNVVCTTACGAAKTFAQMESIVTDTYSYYYQPIDSSGNVCIEGDCRKFEIFWREESTDGVNGDLKVIESKHQ